MVMLQSVEGVTVPSFGVEELVESVLERYWQSVVLPSPNQVRVADNLFNALNPPRAHFDIFVNEMKLLSRRQANPLVADIIARGAPFVWDAVRLVNVQTTAGYKGAAARADELVANPLELRDTGSGGGFPGTNPLSTWVVNRTATGAARLYPAANTVDMLVSSLPSMAHVILGFVNPVAVPKSATVQAVLDETWAEEVLNWQWSRRVNDVVTHVYELKQPWIARPQRSYRINIRYDATGQDETQPIAFTVKRGSDLNAGTAIAS